MPTYAPRRRPERWARGCSGHARVRLGSCASLLLVLAAGCDFPTSLPKWDTQWLVPIKSTSVPVGQLLPASVSTTADGSAFLVSVAPVTLVRTLAELCPDCAASNGQTVPKPAFTVTLADTLRLPSDVAGATLDASTIPATISNGLGFDPIRPGAAARGSLTLTLSSPPHTAGQLTVDGVTDSIPAGSTRAWEIALASGVAVGSAIPAVLVINSPAGSAVRLDTSQRFAVTISPQAVRVLAVNVPVNGTTVSIEPIELNLGEIDPSLVERVRGGALVLDIANSFGVTGTLTMTISAPGATIRKPVQLGTGSTTQRIPLTEQELQSILGKSGVTFTASGTVDAAQPVALTPSLTVQVNAQLELTLGSTAGAADIVSLH